MREGNQRRLLFFNLVALAVIVLAVVFVMGLLIYRDKLAGLEDALNSKEVEINKCEDKFKSREDELDRRLKSAEDKLTDISALMGNTKTSDEIAEGLLDIYAKAGISFSSEGEKIILKFNTAIYFKTNETDLSEYELENIDSFTGTYLETAIDDKFVKHIDRIVVEGHADDGGSYLYNLELSYKRAYSVVNYITDSGNIKASVLDNFKKLLVISGCSYNFPVFTEGNIDRNKSRRVEFKLYIDKNGEEGEAEKELMDKLRKIIERQE